MAGVSTSMSIQDRMTSKLNKIASAFKKMDRAAQAADASTRSVDPGQNFERGSGLIDRAQKKLQSFISKQREAGDGANAVEDAWSRVEGVIKKAIAAFSVAKIVGAIKQATELFSTQYTAEVQLAVVMKSAGMDENDFDRIRSKASELQGKTTFGDEAYIAGAAELGTYLKDADALESMMGTLANYAAGMGGISADPAQMVEYATQLGKALDGAYEGLRKKGFSLSDAQKEIIENGTDLEKVAVITDVINQSWGGLAESFANTPAGKIQQLQNKIGDMGEVIGGKLSNSVMNLMNAVDKFISSGSMENFISNLCLALDSIVNALAWIVDKANEVSQYIQENWTTIAPIFWGVAAAVLGYAVALGIQTLATWIADGAAKSFFATLLTNPLFWIALAIGVVVAAIYKWVQSVGGLKVAWLIVCNAILTAWDWVKIGFFTGVYWVMDLWNRLQLAFYTAGVNIQNFMGDMKAGVLTILQNMVNGAIGIINGFVSTLNKIPGVSIDLIDQVTFGTTAQLENEAAKQARASDLAAYQKKIDTQIAERDAALNTMKVEARAATAQREAEIAAAKAEKAEQNAEDAEEKIPSAWDTAGAGVTDVGAVDSVGSVGSVDSDINIAEEDLKFLRDVAEMRYVQNFVTLTPTVSVDAKISEKIDVDEVVTRIESKLEDEFVIAAEGVYA
ncbi:phage tail tape measure protein [Anaeromassilibacillus senegalensis]|uniref:hypothetical protein n=1 Tax=Anaeromassilibacillus senegalensis TaxID=1673717 RepID=UPI000682B0E0|nr:hypothetical protein [Anaeromassilibacillus senegalensis]